MEQKAGMVTEEDDTPGVDGCSFHAKCIVPLLRVGRHLKEGSDKLLVFCVQFWLSVRVR